MLITLVQAASSIMQKHKGFIKIVILGDSNVGKTTLLHQYVSGKVS